MYTTAPNWMKRAQPLGTPGTKGDWDGFPQWLGFGPTSAARLAHVKAGESLNYLAMREWFVHYSEPVQMLMLTLQILNGSKVVHLHLNTTTNNASLTLVTSCELTSPAFFKPL